MTTLKQVREAAERIKKLGKPIPDNPEAIGYGQTKDMHALADHIISTIETDGDEPVSEEWLREVWGFERADPEDDELYLEHDYNYYSAVINNKVTTFYLDSENGDAWPHDIHNRHQFSQLAQALELKRKGEA